MSPDPLYTTTINNSQHHVGQTPAALLAFQANAVERRQREDWRSYVTWSSSTQAGLQRGHGAVVSGVRGRVGCGWAASRMTWLIMEMLVFDAAWEIWIDPEVIRHFSLIRLFFYWFTNTKIEKCKWVQSTLQCCSLFQKEKLNRRREFTQIQHGKK